MRWIRHLRLSWVIGLVVLIGSLLGANHIMQSPQRADRDGKRDPAPVADRNQPRGKFNGVTATGSVVPENDLVPLVPSVQGEVVKVFVKSDQKVVKGDPLLQMDDRQYKVKLERAEAGIKAAQGLLVESKTALKRFDLEVLGQKQVIKARKLELEAVQKKLSKAEEYVKGGLTQYVAEVEAGKLSIKALDEGIQGEEIKLRAIEISKPDSKVSQAEANLDSAKALRDEAKLGLEACLLKAPEDGTIMKVAVGVGAKFGQQIQQPAFWFYTGGLTVKAEIDPEFASRVAVDQPATVYEYGPAKGKSWTGRVTFVANSFQPKRDPTALPDLFQQSQERVLEVRITLDAGQDMPKLNQKVRVHITGEK